MHASVHDLHDLDRQRDRLGELLPVDAETLRPFRRRIENGFYQGPDLLACIAQIAVSDALECRSVTDRRANTN
jgi:hypothetical protein